MGRDILSEFGPESAQPKAGRMDFNRPEPERDVMDYQPPQGPMHIMETGVGLRGGTNLGNKGSQGRYDSRVSGAKQTTPPIGDGGAGAPGDLNTDRTLLGGSQRG